MPQHPRCYVQERKAREERSMFLLWSFADSGRAAERRTERIAAGSMRDIIDLLRLLLSLKRCFSTLLSSFSFM